MIRIIYSLIVLTYISWVYCLLLTKKKTKYNFYDKPFTIIIPCYNEKPTYIRKCVDSILTSEGKKQIILVDNNSDSLDSIGIINEYKKDSRVLVLNEEKQGKRFAQIKGLKYAENDLIIFVDSDTIVGRTSLIELIKPFQDNNIGATTGQVLLANKNYNFLTRCLNAMYWTSSNIFRRASASLGFMQVCCGALSCYRKEDLLSI